jgi:hypothetical protein
MILSQIAFALGACGGLAEYQVHYNTAGRTRASPSASPDGGHVTVVGLDHGRIHLKPVLGGLMNEYSRAP